MPKFGFFFIILEIANVEMWNNLNKVKLAEERVFARGVFRNEN